MGAALTAMPPVQPPCGSTSSAAPGRAALERLFSAADVDGDGVLSLDEFGRLLAAVADQTDERAVTRTFHGLCRAYDETLALPNGARQRRGVDFTLYRQLLCSDQGLQASQAKVLKAISRLEGAPPPAPPLPSTYPPTVADVLSAAVAEAAAALARPAAPPQLPKLGRTSPGLGLPLRPTSAACSPVCIGGGGATAPAAVGSRPPSGGWSAGSAGVGIGGRLTEARGFAMTPEALGGDRTPPPTRTPTPLRTRTPTPTRTRTPTPTRSFFSAAENAAAVLRSSGALIGLGSSPPSEAAPSECGTVLTGRGDQDEEVVVRSSPCSPRSDAVTELGDLSGEATTPPPGDLPGDATPPPGDLPGEATPPVVGLADDDSGGETDEDMPQLQAVTPRKLAYDGGYGDSPATEDLFDDASPCSGSPCSVSLGLAGHGGDFSKCWGRGDLLGALKGM